MENNLVPSKPKVKLIFVRNVLFSVCRSVIIQAGEKCAFFIPCIHLHFLFLWDSELQQQLKGKTTKDLTGSKHCIGKYFSMRIMLKHSAPKYLLKEM